MARVTIVNDHAEFLELVEEILEGDRYETVTIDGDRADTLDLIRASRPELLMIDIRLGAEGDHGWQIAQAVRRDPGLEELPVLLCSGDLSELEHLEADLELTRRVRTIAKPFSIDRLTDMIEELLADPAPR
jgi:twitching motility two-component system response regulator PilH